MGIDIQCGTGLGVTKQSCNGADIHALGNEQAGVGMAQAVDRYILRQPIFFDKTLLKSLGQTDL